MHAQTWHVDLFIDELGHDTSAHAVLHGDPVGHPEGQGNSRRAPADGVVPGTGDEVAAARALHALADALLVTASEDIEALEHAPVRLDFAGPVGVTSHG